MHRSASSSFRSSRYSLYKKNCFVPLFCENNSENTGENQIRSEPSDITVNQQAKQVFKCCGDNQFGIVSVIYTSGKGNKQQQARQVNVQKNWAKEYCRKMFLKTYDQNTNQPQQIKNQSPFKKEKLTGEYQKDLKSSVFLDSKDRDRSTSERITIQRVNIQGIHLYNKIQIGQNEKGKPVNWFYIQVDLSQAFVNTILLKLVIMISSHIFFQVREGYQSESCKIMMNAFQEIKEAIKNQPQQLNPEFNLKQSESDGSFYSQKSVMLINTQSERSYDLGRVSLSNRRNSTISNNSFSINTSVINQQDDQQHSDKDSTRFRQFSMQRGCGSILPNTIFLVHSSETKQEISRSFDEQMASMDCQFIMIGSSDNNINSPISALNRSPGLKRTFSLQFKTFQSQCASNQVRAETLQLIIANRKKYTHAISTKLDPLKGRPIAYFMLLQFVEQYLCENKKFSYTQKVQVKRIWSKVFDQAQNAIYREATHIYESKFLDLTMGKSLISHQIFQEVHKRSKNASLSVARKSILYNQDLQLRIEQFIHSKQDNKKQDYSQQNFQWCKDLLHSEYQSIKRKLKAGQLKSPVSFKQEIMLFRQFFRKKSENCTSVNLIDYFQAFILDRIFEGLSTIFNFQKEDMHLQAEQVRRKQLALQQQNRRLKSENLDLNQKVTILNQKVGIFKINQEQWIVKISRLQRQVQHLQGSRIRDQTLLNDQQTNQISRYLKQMENLHKKIQQREQELMQLKKQLSNQKIMHRQTKKSHKNALDENIQRQKQFSKIQILSIRQNSQPQNINFACSLGKIDFSEETQQKTRNLQSSLLRIKIKELENRIRAKDEYLKTVEQSNRRMIENLSQQLSQVTNNKDQLELELVSLQQEATQMRLKMSRIDTLQIEKQNIQKHKQAILQSLHHTQTQVALLKQKVQFVQTNLEEEKLTKKALNALVQELSQKNQKMTELMKFAQKNVCDQWVQVQDSSYKSKLNEAMRITHILQKEYIKVKTQLTKYQLLSRKN